VKLVATGIFMQSSENIRRLDCALIAGNGFTSFKAAAEFEKLPRIKAPTPKLKGGFEWVGLNKELPTCPNHWARFHKSFLEEHDAPVELEMPETF